MLNAKLAIDEDDTIEDLLPFARRLVNNMIKSMNLPHQLREDLESAAYLGLTRAVQSAKSNKADSFKKYASIRIRGSVIDFLRKNGYHSPTAYVRVKAALERTNGTHRAVEYLDDSYLAVADTAPNPEEHYLTEEIRGKLRDLVATLPEKERAVIEAHYYGGSTLTELVAEGAQLPCISKRHRSGLNTLRKRLTTIN